MGVVCRSKAADSGRNSRMLLSAGRGADMTLAAPAKIIEINTEPARAFIAASNFQACCVAGYQKAAIVATFLSLVPSAAKRRLTASKVHHSHTEVVALLSLGSSSVMLGWPLPNISPKAARQDALTCRTRGIT